MPIKNGMVDVQCVGTLFLVEGLCFHWEQTEVPDKIQQNISLKYRELLRQPGLKGTTIWEEGEPSEPSLTQGQRLRLGPVAQADGHYQQVEKQTELVMSSWDLTPKPETSTDSSWEGEAEN